MANSVPRRDRVVTGGRNRAKRAKTFKSEEAAHTHAKANGLKKYTLKHLSSKDAVAKKIRIVTDA